MEKFSRDTLQNVRCGRELRTREGQHWELIWGEELREPKGADVQVGVSKLGAPCGRQELASRQHVPGRVISEHRYSAGKLKLIYWNLSLLVQFIQLRWWNALCNARKYMRPFFAATATFGRRGRDTARSHVPTRPPLYVLTQRSQRSEIIET